MNYFLNQRGRGPHKAELKHTDDRKLPEQLLAPAERQASVYGQP